MKDSVHPACQAPRLGEGSSYWKGYLAQCPPGDVRELLLEQVKSVRQVLEPHAGLHDQWAYAPGKWSLAALVGHLADSELILFERLLRAARGDTSPQPPFDEDAFAAQWEAELQPELERWAAQRQSMAVLLRHLPEDAWQRQGQVEDRVYTVRQAAWMLVGHAQHHLRVLAERYLPLLESPPATPSHRELKALDAPLVLEETGIQAWRLGVDGPRRVIRLIMQPGAGLPPHPVPDAALFWVARGHGVLEVDGQQLALEAGDAVVVEGDAQRGWRNPGPAELELHVVRGWR